MSSPSPAPSEYNFVGEGWCRDGNGNGNNYQNFRPARNLGECFHECSRLDWCEGVEWNDDQGCELHRSKPTRA